MYYLGIDNVVTSLKFISADTDLACVISVDCAIGFTLLHWLNLRYGLPCFVFLRLHCGLSSTA